MNWIARCNHYSAGIGQDGKQSHVVRLRGTDPEMEVTICSKDEMPFHVGLEYMVEIEASEGAFV